jgi:hypothetical protein
MKENIHGNNKYTANLRDKNYNQVDSWEKKNTMQYKLHLTGHGLHSTVMHRALTIFTHLTFLMMALSEG